MLAAYRSILSPAAHMPLHPASPDRNPFPAPDCCSARGPTRTSTAAGRLRRRVTRRCPAPPATAPLDARAASQTRVGGAARGWGGLRVKQEQHCALGALVGWRLTRQGNQLACLRTACCVALGCCSYGRQICAGLVREERRLLWQVHSSHPVGQAEGKAGAVGAALGSVQCAGMGDALPACVCVWGCCTSVQSPAHQSNLPRAATSLWPRLPPLTSRLQGCIVNNESSEILRMFNAEFNHLAANPDLDL